MNRVKNMTTKTVSLPQLEYTHLKRNALLTLLVGALFLMDAIYKIVAHFDMSASGLVDTLTFIFVACIIYCGYLVLSLVVDGLNLKGLKKERDFSDEYSLHVIRKGHEYALACGVFIAFVFYLVPDDYVAMLSENMPAIFLAFLALGYAIPTLILLREDHE